MYKRGADGRIKNTMDFFIDESISTTGNIMAAVGLFLTTANNTPQLYQTWTTRKMKSFSTASLLLRVLSNILWFIYATASQSMLLQMSVTVSLFSGLFLLVFKFLEDYPLSKRTNPGFS